MPIGKWDYSLGPPFLRLHEEANGLWEDCNWRSAAFDDTSWSTAEPVIAKQKFLPIVEPRKLRPRTIPALPELPTSFTRALKCEGGSTDLLPRWQELLTREKKLRLPENSEHAIYVEAQALTSGFLHLAYEGGYGSVIRIRCAECFEKDVGSEKGLFGREKGNRSDFQNGVLKGPEDTYTVGRSSAAENVFHYYEPFWFRTFRYIRLSIKTADSPLTIRRFDYRDTKYPLEIKTSNPKIYGSRYEAIWSICLNTLLNCMHETYEDCPYYEQNQFAHDSRLMMLYTYQVSHDDRLARKTIDEFHASQRPDGLLETHFPNTYNITNIPHFSLFWILMLHDHMMYFGDRSLIRRYIGSADRILNYFDRLIDAGTGLVGSYDTDDTCWAFVDWVPEWSSTDGNFLSMAVPTAYKETGFMTFSSLLCAMILHRAADLADFVDRHDTGTEYRARAAALNAAVNTHCFNGEYYLDGPGPRPATERSQHAQVFAVLSGAASERDPSLARKVVQRALTDPSFAQVSYSMRFYLFRAVEVAGADVYAEHFPLLMQPWQKMLDMNLTTCPEAEASPRSDCHGWSAAPIYEIVACVFGLRPGKPGYGVVEVKPLVRMVEREVSGRFVVAGRGTIDVRWEEGGGGGWIKADFDGDVDVEFDGGGSEGAGAAKEGGVLCFKAGEEARLIE